MALRDWLKIAFGTTVVPQPAPLPVPPRLVVIAANVRTAELWLREQGLTYRDRRVHLVTPDRADRLRGLGGPLDVIWVCPSDWWTGVANGRQLWDYVGYLRARGDFNSEQEVWV